MVINTNIQAMSAARNFGINTKNKAKSAEKLSSGYSINRAADDAADLTISEKMRAQIRALNKGTQNAQSGVSWVHVGEAALGSIQDMIHRMSEITIQSLNDTNTDLDRAALQAEFDQLQSEIDKVSDTTMFNTKKIFADHEPKFYQFEGNINWNQSARHTIDSTMNTLTISYIKDDNSAAEQLTITVPEGTYTTQELIDEVDDAVAAAGGGDAGINLEYTQSGTCNVNIESGKSIESISGGLSYLINDMYTGGSVGALIGTTTFVTDDARLGISAGKNDELRFRVQDFNGNTSTVNIKIPAGRYTRSELIDILNNSMGQTGVEAVKYGKSIKLQSDTAIITGFKGNMFKIDTDPGDIHTSVFYDNVQYGNTILSEASFKGGAVIPVSGTDEEHNHYTIDASNDSLTLAVDGGSEVTLSIAHGRYTSAKMVDALNELMANAGLGATASLYTSGNFNGIQITTASKGIESRIDIKNSSSAYDTLFCKREYNRIDSRASESYETRPDDIPVFTGGKAFSTGTLPLTITASQNDVFKLALNGTAYNITIKQGTYNSASDIVTAIDEALNGNNALMAYKNKVDVSNDAAGRIILKGSNGSGLTDIKAEALSGNTGFHDIWVGTKVEYRSTTAFGSGSSGSPAKITLNTPINNPADAAGKNFSVDINGNRHNVSIPSGVSSRDDIINAINDQLKEQKIITINKFATINSSGTTTNNNVTASGSGNTSTESRNYTSTGVTKESQGVVGAYDVNRAASITLDKKIGSTNIVNASNNRLAINVKTQNGTSTVNITIPDGSYSADGLASAIQKQLDNRLGTQYGGVKVSLNNGALTFTSRLNDGSGNEKRADETGLEISTGNSSFLKELYTTRTAAQATSSKELEKTMIIGPDNAEFVFTYRDGAGTRNIRLDLAAGTYDRTGIVNEINRQLLASGTNITASLYNNRLRLTSNGIGQDYMISYNNMQGGSSAETLFGDFIVKKPASATAQQDMQEEINITDDTSSFIISVNGTPHNITLDNGTYDRQAFAGMLNTKFQDEGIPAEVSLSGKRLTYTTTEAGAQTNIFMTYDGGGTSMLPIYGKTETVKAGAKASFNADGKLELTGTENGGSLSVSSSSGGGFQSQERIESDINPTAKSGYISSQKAYIDGVNLSEPVVIDEWNRELSFTYRKAGVSQGVNFKLSDGTYDFKALTKELQGKLDVFVGSGELIATVDASGVKIESTHTGSGYSMSGFSGGFYYNVLCKSTEVSQKLTPSQKAGGQICDAAFTIGRKNIRGGSVTVEKDLNDEFTFDITCGNTVNNITVKLTDGEYDGNSLIAELQKQINKKLEAAGLPKDMVKAQIGGVNTGVVGANDNDALCLKINDNTALPDSGQYIIDGVRGSAAFNIFYQTDGRMIPAYTTGAKDITDGLTVTADNNTLSLDADGRTYSVTLADGDYTADELADAVNAGFNAGGAPLTAKIEDGRLKIQYNSFGRHIIDNVAGSARDSLFYVKNSAAGEKENIKIQLSGNAGRDYIELDRPVMNTVSLGINSLAITKPKYANKALERLAGALDAVSSIRSDYGAMENRLEHAINGNNNTAENTQSAESLVRDTDIASETVRYASNSILEQAAQSMIAQANIQAQGVLKLLGQ